MLNELYEKYKNIYNIFIVYINEAHAVDVWNIGESAGSLNYSHKQLGDRIGYAKQFQSDYKILVPIICDNMLNECENVFSAWPVRYYIVVQRDGLNLIDLISEPVDSELDIIGLFNLMATKYLNKIK